MVVVLAPELNYSALYSVVDHLNSARAGEPHANSTMTRAISAAHRKRETCVLMQSLRYSIAEFSYSGMPRTELVATRCYDLLLLNLLHMQAPISRPPPCPSPLRLTPRSESLSETVQKAMCRAARGDLSCTPMQVSSSRLLPLFRPCIIWLRLGCCLGLPAEAALEPVAEQAETKTNRNEKRTR